MNDAMHAKACWVHKGVLECLATASTCALAVRRWKVLLLLDVVLKAAYTHTHHSISFSMDCLLAAR